MENGLRVNKEVGRTAGKLWQGSSLGIIVAPFVVVTLGMEAYDAFMEIPTLEVASAGPGGG